MSDDLNRRLETMDAKLDVLLERTGRQDERIQSVEGRSIRNAKHLDKLQSRVDLWAGALKFVAFIALAGGAWVGWLKG